MLIPPRCFTCGKIIGNKWNMYLELIKKGISEMDALDALGMNRLCCRCMFLTHFDLINKFLEYAVVSKEKNPPKPEIPKNDNIVIDEDEIRVEGNGININDFISNILRLPV